MLVDQLIGLCSNPESSFVGLAEGIVQQGIARNLDASVDRCHLCPLGRSSCVCLLTRKSQNVAWKPLRGGGPRGKCPCKLFCPSKVV